MDLAGRTVMPGLIDCHIHFAHWGMNLIAHQGKSLMLLAAETVAALRTTLEAGCTTARDLGGLDAGFREAVARGLIAGTSPAVQPGHRLADQRDRRRDDRRRDSRRRSSPACPGRNATAPTSARAKVREVLRQGADVIKIATSGGVSSAKRRSEAPDLHRRKRSRRSSTRPTWPGCRCAATRSAVRGS